jgi:NAD(P)H-dependent flavin oxidoreductase YrpB (nitropropane dioxygenase family)
MARYAEWCGWALARAHAKAGDAAMLSGYLGASGKVDEAIASFAVTYADQNERDHQALLKAIRDGKIAVYHEE